MIEIFLMLAALVAFMVLWVMAFESWSRNEEKCYCSHCGRELQHDFFYLIADLDGERMFCSTACLEKFKQKRGCQ